jgi:hypothetical protein
MINTLGNAKRIALLDKESTMARKKKTKTNIKATRANKASKSGKTEIHVVERPKR